MKYKINNIFNFLVKFVSRPYLVILGVVVTVALVWPMLFYSINADPRLIPYFDADEGYGRDLAWYYYSGEKLETFQYSLDYGVEYYLIIDLIARPVSLFIPLTPNRLLLIMRLFHFICGLMAVFFLWKFTKRHFPSNWIPTFTCLSLIASPQFVWYLDHIKPEPFLVILIILGLDYTLRMLDNPSWKNLSLAVFFSASAFMIKLRGIFLLPSILLVLYFLPLSGNKTITKSDIYKIIKQMALLLLSVIVLILLILSIIIPIGSKFYLKLKTKNFDLEQFISTFNPPKSLSILIYIVMTLLVIACISLIIFLYRKNKESIFYKKIAILPLFIASSVLVGYRWSFNLFDWVFTYTRWLLQQKAAPLNLFLKSDFFQAIQLLIKNINGWLVVFAQNDALEITGIILLIIYFAAEVIVKPWRNPAETKRFLKRIVMLSFCLVFIIFLFLFQSRLTAQHLIMTSTFFLLLSYEGLRLIFIKVRPKKALFSVVIILTLTLVLLNLYKREHEVFRRRIYTLRKKTDIVHTIALWWKENCPYDTKIVADSPCWAYIPSEFNNVFFVKPGPGLLKDSSFKPNPEHLKNIILEEKPEIIYYYSSQEDKDLSVKLEEILKEFSYKKIKEFKQNTSHSFRLLEDDFIVYQAAK